MTFNEIKKAVPNLTLAELEELEKLVKFNKLRIKGGVEDFDLNRFYSALYEEMKRELKKSPIPANLSMLKAQNADSYRAVLSKHAQVKEWLHSTLGDNQIQKSHRVLFYHWLFSAIIQNLKYNTVIPLALRTVLGQIDRIDSYVERSFPGYLSSGLFHWVIKSYGQQR